jgi:serine/threonine-protein phosphatase 2A regulatory subunit A
MSILIWMIQLDVFKKKMDSLYPIAVLIEELKSEDTKRRINSIRNLKSIAIALGADRTRKELIPYLSELMDDEEEVLLALAEELGNFMDCTGGRMHAHILFDPLEKLT